MVDTPTWTVHHIYAAQKAEELQVVRWLTTITGLDEGSTSGI